MSFVYRPSGNVRIRDEDTSRGVVFWFRGAWRTPSEILRILRA